jgi:hypothetical protein
MKYATRFLMLTVTLLPMLAAAQIQGNTRLKAQVPFDFMIGSKTVPAGPIILEAVAPGTHALAMRNVQARVNLFANPTRVETRKPAATSELVFHKYGHRYFLSEVKVEGSQTTYQLPESRAEAELRAQNMNNPEEILLALK